MDENKHWADPKLKVNETRLVRTSELHFQWERDAQTNNFLHKNKKGGEKTAFCKRDDVSFLCRSIENGFY